jgi:hypothetical protein
MASVLEFGSGYRGSIPRMGSVVVAELVKHQIVALEAGGSNPLDHTNACLV